MCGILCCITPLTPCRSNNGEASIDRNSACPFCTTDEEIKDEIALMKNFLRNRGPDASNEECITQECQEISFQIHLSGNVLWTQGPQPTPQPMISGSQYFLFNGDIYSFGDMDQQDSSCSITQPGTTEKVYGKQNDGERLFKILSNHAATDSNLEKRVQHITNVFGNVQGPFAFMLYDRQHNHLWFGRDFCGRQSLLISIVKNSLVFSSISPFLNTLEVPTAGLFCYSIEKNEITLYPWTCHERTQIAECTDNFCKFIEDIGVKVNTDTLHPIGMRLTTTVKPPNDIDSNSVLKELLNVTSDSSDDLMQALLQVTEILTPKIDQLLIHLRNSIERRILTKPPYCKKCIEKRAILDEPCKHSKLGVLFSGGLDSMVLAYLTAEILVDSSEETSIDLINVAFFQDDHIPDSAVGKDFSKSTPPDRRTGWEAHFILSQIFEARGISLNFVEVNVSKSRVRSVREAQLRHLISPLTSVLDDSLGCCLWFAAEATSTGLSDARILLLGSGADELFGGYGRHRSAYESGGWIGLMNEMQLEIDRISVRNMGRDNRVVSDHSVSSRLPFLDENVVRFVTQDCDIWEKCCPLKGLTNTNGPDISYSLGDKMLLRATAMKLLSSQKCDGIHLALFPKRAMQFGSRIAKLENSKEKGGDACSRLIQK